MKYVVFLVGAILMVGGSATAQDEASAAPEPDAAEAEAAPAEEPAPAGEQAAPPEEEKRSVYYKKVQGLLWIEAFAGPTSYDPDQFGSLGSQPNAPKLTGPEGGLSVLAGLGGFGIGAFYRQANYTQYKLMKVGMEIQGTFRFIPYVHPMVRIDIGYARTFNGNPYGLTNADSDGLVFTGGVGLRIPIIRWMSIAASFDWSFVALSIRGNGAQEWIAGQQLGGTFALTFHFFGVRKN
jgi:hypothetical protein